MSRDLNRSSSTTPKPDKPKDFSSEESEYMDEAVFAAQSGTERTNAEQQEAGKASSFNPWQEKLSESTNPWGSASESESESESADEEDHPHEVNEYRSGDVAVAENSAEEVDTDLEEEFSIDDYSEFDNSDSAEEVDTDSEAEYCDNKSLTSSNSESSAAVTAIPEPESRPRTSPVSVAATSPLIKNPHPSASFDFDAAAKADKEEAEAQQSMDNGSSCRI